jgi:integrase
MYLFKRKNGNYYLQFKDDISGKFKMVSTKAKFKPDALKFLANFKALLQEKIKANDKEKSKVLYLEDLQKEVMRYITDNMTISTTIIYRIVFRDMMRIFGNKALKLITISDVENFKSIRAGEVKKATVNRDLSTMKSIFNNAIRFDWMNKNPVKSVKKLSIPEKEYLSFTDDQLKLIITSIHNANIRNIVLVGAFTGCRLDEILNLKWCDVDFADRILKIRNKANFKTKTGKIRDIPISDSLFNLLDKLIKSGASGNILNFYNPDNYIFQNLSGYRYSKFYISKYFKKILRKLNFDEKFHFHCLRHTAISTMIKNDVNMNYVKEIAGHSEISTTMNYIHIKTEDLRNAVNTININY